MPQIFGVGGAATAFACGEKALVEIIVKKESVKQLDLSDEINRLIDYYSEIRKLASAVDSTLNRHVEALQTGVVNHLHVLEKKMLKAEKRKFEAQQRQVHAIKGKLFPKNNLQERIDNFMPYYAKFGREFISTIYDHSPALEQEFVVLNL